MNYKTYAIESAKLDLKTEIMGARILYYSIKLVGETGEVADKIGKLYRNHNGEATDEFKQSIMLELGDVAWYATQILSYYNSAYNPDDIGLREPKNEYRLFVALQDLACNAADVFQSGMIDMRKSTNDTQLRVYRTHWVLAQVGAIAAYFGGSIEQVFEMNIAKLSDRKERGVIASEGDNR